MDDTEDAWWEDEQFLTDVYRGADEAVASRNPSLTPAPAPATQYPAAAAAASCPPRSARTTSAPSLSHASAASPTSTDSTRDSKPSAAARDSADLFSHLLSYTHNELRDSPVSAASRLSDLLLDDTIDRVSHLPDALLCNIVSRLPVKDAARTSALSHRWRKVWHSAPVVLADNDLLPVAGRALSRHEIPAAVSHILTAHPGPFRCIHLTNIHMEEFKGPLMRWLHLLAVKGTQELVLANRPPPLHRQLRLPVAVFSISTLTRLYLAFFKFPNTAGLPCTASFPNLRELGLYNVLVKSCHMEFILARSPVLEILYLQGNLLMDRLNLMSHSLRSVHVIASSDLDITVQEAPHLERLIIWVASTRKGCLCNTVEIGNAPALTLLGYLEPQLQNMRIGGKTIKTKNWTSECVVPTVRILALKVRFGVYQETEFLSSFLRCFPNVERLHIESKKTAESTSKLTLTSWEKYGAIECIRSKLKLVFFQNFRGADCELCFLKFLLETAGALTKVVILYDKENFNALSEVHSMLEPLYDSIWASSCCSVLLTDSAPSKMP